MQAAHLEVMTRIIDIARLPPRELPAAYQELSDEIDAVETPPWMQGLPVMFLPTARVLELPGETRVLIENTAGAGLTVGKTPAEVGAMLDGVPSALRRRTGYGLDTCHLFSAGHDITASQKAFTRIIDEFEAAAGSPPAFFHLNDSEGPLGSNRDRHVLIGDGLIGVEPFRWLMRDRRSAGIPLILETPQQNYEIGEDDDSPDPYDVRMVELLRSLER